MKKILITIIGTMLVCMTNVQAFTSNETDIPEQTNGRCVIKTVAKRNFSGSVYDHVFYFNDTTPNAIRISSNQSGVSYADETHYYNGSAWVALGGSSVIKYVDTLTATSGQTVFVSSYSFLGAMLDVYLNGSKLAFSEYSVTGLNSITINVAARTGDIIEINIYKTPIANAGYVINVVNGNYTATSYDYIIFADTNTNDIIVTLPLTSLASPKGYSVKNIGSKSLTIVPSGSETIDGQTSWIISNSK